MAINPIHLYTIYTFYTAINPIHLYTLYTFYTAIIYILESKLLPFSIC